MFGANKEQTEKLRKEQDAIVAEAQGKLDVIKKNHEGILVAIELDKEVSADLKKGIKNLESLHTVRNEELDLAEKRLADINQKIDVADNELTALVAEKVRIKKEIEDTIAQREAIILDAIAEIEIAKSKAQDELDGLTSAIASAEVHFDVFNERVVAVKNKLEETESELVIKQGKLLQVKNSIIEEEDRFEELIVAKEGDLEELFDEVTRLTNQKESLDAEIAKRGELSKHLATDIEEQIIVKNGIVKENSDLLLVKAKIQVELGEAKSELVAIRQYDRYVSAKEDHLRGVASELGVEYKEYKAA